MMLINGANFIKIHDMVVRSPGWFDVELPNGMILASVIDSGTYSCLKIVLTYLHRKDMISIGAYLKN